MAFSEFVAKLAAHGARDPEALGAWIGRKNHGVKAFAKLAERGAKHAAEHRQQRKAAHGLAARIGRSSDLGGFSDEELATAAPHLSGEHMGRVVTEMEHRDTAARISPHPHLVGMSDEQLAHHAATGPEQMGHAAAEMDRRDTMKRLFPGGKLAKDLSGLSDEDLRTAGHYAPGHEISRLMAEQDRRHPIHVPGHVEGSSAAERTVAGHHAVDDALGESADGFAAWALPDHHGSLSDAEKWLAERTDTEHAQAHAYSPQQIREMYDQHIYQQWLDAEHATAGNLLSRHAAAAGHDPRQLFTGPAHVAYSRASDDLKRHWEQNPRTTLAEFTHSLTGRQAAAAATARHARHDQHRRL